MKPWVSRLSEKRQPRWNRTVPAGRRVPRAGNTLPSGETYSFVLRRGHILREHFRQRRVVERVEVELVLEFAIVPVIDRQQARAPERGFVSCGASTVISIRRRSGTEAIDGSPRTGGRNHQQVARLVEGQVHRVQRIIALDGESFGFRPAIDALLMVIHKIKLAGTVHGGAGDGKEAVFELLDLRARCQHRGGIGWHGRRRIAGMSSTANSRSRTSR